MLGRRRHGASTLRRRILLLTTGVTALVLALFAVPLGILLRSAALDDAADDCGYVAQNVADYVSTSSYDTTLLTKYLARVNDRGDAEVAVYLPDGTSVGATLPKATGSPAPVYDSTDGPGKDDKLGSVGEKTKADAAGGQLVEIPVHNDSGEAVVRAYVTDGSVHGEVLQRFGILAGACVLLLALAALAAEVVSRRLVRPLEATAGTADRISAGELTARAPVTGPAEVASVAAALNRLAARIDDLLVAERETVADLSHRLRTPLTAVRLDVESLPDSPRTRELSAHLTELERTLTGVIRAARRPQAGGVDPRCDASTVVAERAAFWAPLAEDQGRTATIDVVDGPLAVKATADDLAAALDALLENVIAHTPEGTPFAITLRRVRTDAVIEVRDHGPGIPDGAHSRGRSDRGSSGLGLDIARSCAEGSGGRLEILREGDETVVRMTLLPPA